MSTLEEILASFEQLEPADRLEWLIGFGSSLPVLPVAYHAERNEGRHIVHECQAPVFLKVEVAGGIVAIHTDVPREAPIARGFVSILKTAFDGEPAECLRKAPADMLQALNIRDLLGMQRLIGLSAIYAVLRAAVL